MIEVRDVWYWYDRDVAALKGVSLMIEKGETVAIIGQNGGGKTTLAKHMNGLLKPSKGDVYVKGYNTKNTPTHVLATIVAYVFQNPSHQIFMSTVYDEVAYGPTQKGLPKDVVAEMVAKALEIVGLTVHPKTHPYDLDYGQMKLVTIASAIAVDPEFFVLDEPTTGQDHRSRARIAEVVKKLNRMGKTVVVITHDMRFVAETAARTVVMADGEIVADGPTAKVLSDVELLTKASLKPPQTVLLTRGLRGYGYEIEALTLHETVTGLKQLLKCRT